MLVMKKTYFCDQGEFLGGAELFLLQFLESLSDSEKKRVNPILLGGISEKYQQKIPINIPHQKFVFPAVRGGFLRKILACWKILWTARKIQKITTNSDINIFVTNTPRTHFVLFIAKKIWRLDVKWIAIFHDFTTRPDSLLNKICTKADLIIANSMPTRTFLRQKIDSNNFPKIRIIENGIDFTKIPSANQTLQIKNVLLIGRIDPRKGQKFAVQVANILKNENPELNFMIVGDAVQTDSKTTEYEKKIKKLAQEKNLSNIQFSPAVYNPFPIINSADLILVLPTEPETFGRVVIEALAMGKLVLAFNEIGPKEILDQFEKFVLQKSKKTEITILRTKPNAKELANKISYFIKNPKELQLFTKYARNFTEERFDFKETKKSMFKALEE